MLFNSPLFLFLFLPLTLLGHFIIGEKLKNSYLLVLSLLFYAWGESFFILVLCTSIVFNYVMAISISHLKSIKAKYAAFVLYFAITINLILLFSFKYLNFIVNNLNFLLDIFHLPLFSLPAHALPLGISFFTFHAISYLIDIYRGDCPVQKNFINMALYISFFPQIIAGPIIRYKSIADQILKRTVNTAAFNEGVRRFITGLGKKVLIADAIGYVANKILITPESFLTFGLCWLGALCFTLQIFLDFSGYSDMAIGLGKMFGFTFIENFNFPYVSKSIREFWRRWHMSLSTWFRDYLYIPLGGNKVSINRTYINLAIVFLLVGLWHGANWTFIIWGIWNGVFLIFERTSAYKGLARLWGPLQHLYALFVVMAGFVIFFSPNLTYTGIFFKKMFLLEGLKNTAGLTVSMYLDRESVIAIGLGCFFSMDFYLHIYEAIKTLLHSSDDQWKVSTRNLIFPAFRLIWYSSILLLSCMGLASNTYNPFIYFKF